MKESQAAQDQAPRELKSGTHTRFTNAEVVGASVSAAAMAKIQARASDNQEESSGEESELQVITGSSEPENGVAECVKGKEKETTPSKKRRRGMDPWAGNG